MSFSIFFFFEKMDVVRRHAGPVTAFNLAAAAFTANQLFQAANNAYNTASEVVDGVNRVYKRARAFYDAFDRLSQAASPLPTGFNWRGFYRFGYFRRRRRRYRRRRYYRK